MPPSPPAHRGQVPRVQAQLLDHPRRAAAERKNVGRNEY